MRILRIYYAKIRPWKGKDFDNLRRIFVDSTVHPKVLFQANGIFEGFQDVVFYINRVANFSYHRKSFLEFYWETKRKSFWNHQKIGLKTYETKQRFLQNSGETSTKSNRRKKWDFRTIFLVDFSFRPLFLFDVTQNTQKRVTNPSDFL